MQISKRLEAVADMVTPGCRLADIGTDHAYIPIYLAQAGKISHAVAMDVNKGPLMRAKEHIASFGLEDVIGTRLSDGLEALQPGEADEIVIAGMGGPLTVRILRDGAEKIAKGCSLILQPQSEIKEVRSYLNKIGYRIIREEMICEDGKYYPMMKAVPKERSNVSESEESRRIAGMEASVCDAAVLRYGLFLIRQKHPVLKEYLLKEQTLNRRILVSLEGQTGEGAMERKKEVEYELFIIAEVLKYTGM